MVEYCEHGAPFIGAVLQNKLNRLVETLIQILHDQIINKIQISNEHFSLRLLSSS